MLDIQLLLDAVSSLWKQGNCLPMRLKTLKSGLSNQSMRSFYLKLSNISRRAMAGIGRRFLESMSLVPVDDVEGCILSGQTQLTTYDR